MKKSILLTSLTLALIFPAFSLTTGVSIPAQTDIALTGAPISCAKTDISTSAFTLSPLTDGILASTSLALCTTDIILDKAFNFGYQEYSTQTFDIQSVNGFDRVFMRPYSSVLDKISDGLCIATILAPSVLFALPYTEYLTVGVMYAETLAFTLGIKEILKMSISRTRPYMYFSDFPQTEIDNAKWNRSFPSGHTSYAFASAAFTSYTFCKYFPQSKWKIPVLAASYALAFSTASLRLASGSHFATDILAGVGIGSVCGFLVPFFHTLSADNKTLTDNGEIALCDNAFVKLSPLALQIKIRY